ncbi:MAG: hypothetical protein O3B86_13865, partial [Planctomycetota bacterium]|nr:hypothetical protein [Planctomycetota bacterium]
MPFLKRDRLPQVVLWIGERLRYGLSPKFGRTRILIGEHEIKGVTLCLLLHLLDASLISSS